MDGNQRKYKGQVEINDIIGDAVNNAVARRNQAINSENALLDLPNEEATNIIGGLLQPIIVGYFPPIKPPIDV